MDIKLRKFSENMVVRVVAFILCVALFITTLIGTMLMSASFRQLDYVAGVEDLFQKGTYEESADLQYEFTYKLHDILWLLTEYKSEAYISSGKTVSNDELENAVMNLFYNGQYTYAGSTIYSNGYISNENSAYSEIARQETEAAYEAGDISHEEYELFMENYNAQVDIIENQGYDGNLDYNNAATRQAFIAANTQEIEQIKKNLIKDDLREFDRLKKELNEIEGFTYYATDGEFVLTNLKLNSGEAVDAEQFSGNPAYLLYQNDQLAKLPAQTRGNDWNVDQSMEETLDNYYNDDMQIFFAFDQQFIAAKQLDYTAAKGEMVKWLPLVGGAALGTLILFIWLVVTTGKRDIDGNRKRYGLDKIWTEIQLAIIAISMSIGAVGTNEIANPYYVYNLGGSTSYMTGYAGIPLFDVILAATFGSILAAIGLWFILSCVRLIKARMFIKNSILYKVIAAIGGAVMAIYNGSSVMRKVVLITVAVCLLSATVFLAPVVLVAILVFAPKWVMKYESVKTGVDEVKSGNLSYKIPITGKGELDHLAQGINEISEASNIAVQNELKNQRMKTELISNVSHDLKTPLTSMVTYVDLMKTEGLDSPNAAEYLDVLDQKTNRLRQLTEDLFEAAKASSGAIPVRMEKVEMLSLIHQGLGEFDQRIKESEMEFIINAAEEKYYVWADGQLLWRVVENLLSNVLKYAQERTRVYIDVSERGNNAGGATMAVLEIKNVSKQALNIDPDELIERFKRGDEARTTEGSGLGLAIAKDLVKLQNGWFEIKIDGDLFKATVMLAKHVESEE